jgi:hypothetical protein
MKMMYKLPNLLIFLAWHLNALIFFLIFFDFFFLIMKQEFLVFKLIYFKAKCHDLVKRS